MAIAQARLVELGEDDPRRRLWVRLESGWHGCGWSSLFRDEATGVVVGLPDHCDRPLCPWCERGRRTARVRRRYQAVHDVAVADRRLYFAVLTIPNVPLGGLVDGFGRIRKALERLRRQRWFARHVAGGLWRLELTVNLETRSWHPHVNLLLETRRRESMQHFLQEQLQTAWRRALGHAPDADGDYTWIELGWNRGGMREAVKHQVAWRFDDPQEDNQPAGDPQVDHETSLHYSAKPPGIGWIDALDPAWVIEYCESQPGRRAVGTFGSWREVDEPDPEHSVEELVEAPYAIGDDLSPWAPKRYLPAYVPTVPRSGRDPASWLYYGRGPRWGLKHCRPPDGGDPWLVWSIRDGPDPAFLDDDPPFPVLAPVRLRAGP